MSTDLPRIPGNPTLVELQQAYGGRRYVTEQPDRCSTCGHLPGRWSTEGFTGAQRRDLVLNECRECGASWPSS